MLCYSLLDSPGGYGLLLTLIDLEASSLGHLIGSWTSSAISQKLVSCSSFQSCLLIFIIRSKCTSTVSRMKKPFNNPNTNQLQKNLYNKLLVQILYLFRTPLERNHVQKMIYLINKKKMKKKKKKKKMNKSRKLF